MISKSSVAYAVWLILIPIIIFSLVVSTSIKPLSDESIRPGLSYLESSDISVYHQTYYPLIFMDWSPAVSILISEVLFNPSGDEPEAEWIEVYNYGLTEINLYNFKIGDSETLGDFEGMYLFPPSAKISSGGVILIANESATFKELYGFKPDYEVNNTDLNVPDLVKDLKSAHGSMSLSNSGDEVILISLTESYIDMVSWGSSHYAFSPSVPIVPDGYSIERYPPHVDTNSARDWRDQYSPSPGYVDLSPPPTHTPLPATQTSTSTKTPINTPIKTNTASIPPSFTPSKTATQTNTFTPTLTPSSTSTMTPTPTSTHTPTQTLTPSPADHLLISEVLYDPYSSEPQNEWIEIYNPTQSSIALDDYKIGDEESAGGIEGMLIFPTGYTIVSAERLVIANNGAAFSFNYGYPPAFEMHNSDPSIPDMLVYDTWSSGDIHLDNIGDEVLLLGLSDNLIDAMSWGTSSFAFDPPCPDVPEGHSLERYPANIDTDTADDWIDQDIPSPGIP